MLEKERKYFEEHQLEWLNQFYGKFVLIKDEELIGTYEKPEDALSEGARRFGKNSFLVRSIEEDEQLIYIPALTLGILSANSAHSI
jgi:hypothetical protein